MSKISKHREWDEDSAMSFCKKYFRGQKYFISDGLLCFGDEVFDHDTVEYCLANDTLHMWGSYCYDMDMINGYVDENMRLPRPTIEQWHRGECGRVSRSTLRDMLNVTHRFSTSKMDLLRSHEKAVRELESNNIYYL